MNQYHVPSPSFSEIILLFNPSLSITTHSLVHLLSAMLAHSMFTASLKHCLVTCRFAYILPSLFPWTTPNQTGYVVAQPVEWHASAFLMFISHSKEILLIYLITYIPSYFLFECVKTKNTPNWWANILSCTPAKARFSFTAPWKGSPWQDYHMNGQAV